MIRELKTCKFEWDEDKRELTVTTKDGQAVKLNKVQMFSMMRFIVRISQWAFLRKK